MAFRKIRFAGFELATHASPNGAGLSIGFGGPMWDRFVAWIRHKRGPASTGAESLVPPPPVVVPEGLAGDPVAVLKAQVDSITWYHTLELGSGVVTPGHIDHRELMPLYRLPDSMAGQRVLDVATFDGFWAFDFERRGAREVIALDLDKPIQLDFPPKVRAKAPPGSEDVKLGRGFAIAKAALGSKVERVTCSVYDLAPEKYGMFDVVHAGDFLIHLNSPVRALQNIASVCSGYALISDVYTPHLDLPASGHLIEYRGGASDVTWWNFSLGALEQMVLDAGFSRVERVATFKYGQRGLAKNMNHVILKAFK